MTTYTNPCSSCGQPWDGWGTICNDCQRLKAQKDNASQNAEIASDQARASQDASQRLHRAMEAQADADFAQRDRHNKAMQRQTESHNYAMEEAADRQATAAEETLRITRRVEWARTHPKQTTKAKAPRTSPLADGKLIDNNTTLEEFIQIWDNTDAFLVLLNAYQKANSNDNELNLNDMYIEQGDIESALNLKRLQTEREILEAMEDGRWDDAEEISYTRDLTVPDDTTQQNRTARYAQEKQQAHELATKQAEIVRLEKLSRTINERRENWKIADAARVERQSNVLMIIYTVLFLIGCVYFAPWSTDWWQAKLFGLVIIYAVGMSVTVIPMQPKPGIVPDFNSLIAEETAKARADAYKQSAPYVEDENLLPPMPGTNTPAKERKEPLFK